VRFGIGLGTLVLSFRDGPKGRARNPEANS
jgi:hypothetical protein